MLVKHCYLSSMWFYQPPQRCALCDSSSLQSCEHNVFLKLMGTDFMSARRKQRCSERTSTAPSLSISRTSLNFCICNWVTVCYWWSCTNSFWCNIQEKRFQKNHFSWIWSPVLNLYNYKWILEKFITITDWWQLMLTREEVHRFDWKSETVVKNTSTQASLLWS